MLSSLAKGCGSWTGDLETTSNTVGHQKPILVTSLNGECSKFLEKSVTIPLRVKSAIGSSSFTPELQDNHSLVEAIEAKLPKTEYNRRPKSVCTLCSAQNTPASKVTPRRYRSATDASNHGANVTVLKDTPSSTASHGTFAKYGRRLKSAHQPAFVQQPHTCGNNSTSEGSSSVLRDQRSDGQLKLPKTYITRKGALMLFAAPKNLNFSHRDQKCYFRNAQEQIDIGKLSLTLGTVNNLATSILSYGRQIDDSDDEEGDDGKNNNVVKHEEPHMQFVRDNQSHQRIVDYRAQPGADFVFYLRDMQSRAVVRNFVDDPSKRLVSVDSRSELTAALRDIDHSGSSSPEFGGVTSPNKQRRVRSRQQLSSAGSVRHHSRNGAASRASTSDSSTGGALSVEQLAASLKSSPYLGHPLSAPYPPTSNDHPLSPDNNSSRHGGANSRLSGTSRGGSPLSARSHASMPRRLSENYEAVRLQENTDTDQSGDYDGNMIQSVTISSPYRGSVTTNRELISTDGDSMALLIGQSSQVQWRHGTSVCSSEGVPSPNRIPDAHVTSSMSEAVLSERFNRPEQLDARKPSSSVSHRTYISATTSVPTTKEGSQMGLTEGLPEGLGQLEIKQDMLDDDMLQGDQDVLRDDQDMLHIDQDVLHDYQDMLHDDQDVPQDDQDMPQGDQDVSHDDQDVLHDDQDVLQDDQDVPHDDQDVPQDDQDVLHDDQDMLHDDQDVLHIDQDAVLCDSHYNDGIKTDDEGYLAAEVDSQAGGSLNVLPTQPSINLRDTASPECPMVESLHPATQHQNVSSDKSINESLSLQIADRTVGVDRTVNKQLVLPDSVNSSVRQLSTQRAHTVSSPKPQAALTKKISKLDLGKLKAMIKPPAAKPAKSSRTGRKTKGGTRPKSTGIQYIDSITVDRYEGPSEDEIENMVQEELAKELQSSQLNEEDVNTTLLGVPEEQAEDMISLATDDEALDRELQKQSSLPGRKMTKKRLAKEKEILREERHQEKLRREEELKELAQKKKRREEEKRKEQLAEQRKKQMAKEELEDAAMEAERAAEAEEEARLMLQESRKLAREEREARRKGDMEWKKKEREKRRMEQKKIEEAARQREQQMAERLAGAADKRRLREQAEWETQERDRIEQEEREQEEEEEKQRQEAEEERIREMEKEAEEEALARLVQEREEAETRMRQAKVEAERQKEKAQRMKLEEERKRMETEALQRRSEEEAAIKRQEELDKIRKIQKIEEDAREKVKKELARRRMLAVRRREFNQGQKDSLNLMRQTQGVTRPWIFSYYVHWPKENYERRVFNSKKKKRRITPKPKQIAESQI